MNEPKIRFKGFQGEWETHALSEYFKKVCDKNTKMECTIVLTNSAEHGIIPQNDFFDHAIANNKNIGGYYIVSPDDFVYNPRVSVTAPVGPINRSLLDFQGVMSRLYLVFKINAINKDYLNIFYKTNKWHTFMKLEGNCGARFDRLSISDDQFVKMPLTHPKDHSEQQSIASYFQHHDSLIQSTTKKIESLKQVKAASLQSMFPQEGATTPRVRFKGFEGEWEKVRASNVFKTFNEKNRPDLPVLSATQDRGMVTREAIGYNIFHDKSNEATYKHILPGQFIIHLRSFQGGFAHSSIEGIASPAYTIMEFKDKTRHFDLYWKYIFVSKEFIKRLELITYGIRDGRSISFEEFSEMYFTVPSYEEQKKIASYITTLDRQITLQTQRLEKLKQIKAACLDKMFV